ncbi:unnamed protein product [Acanthoscelides obtectus]|uniref:Uncharacterized protein n=1 Tax=Acanthoscelides obtectus TaxID=200917 RepID=A0A9P0LS37_ACAOB|nr:unnamed protein product [Acanthoscelides obtectus]CAK1641473.1 hypothetical protein AOBTE_LOCUS12428 [Acanthoscelides obtectus]
MDSYDLFGEDGTGMLEGLPDLGSSAGFDPSVTGGNRNAAPGGGGGPQQAQQQAYQNPQAAQQPSYQPQPGQGQGQTGPGDHTSPLQKLASFGGSAGGGPAGGDPSVAAAAMYGSAGGYGAGPTDGRGMGPPPHTGQANAYQRMVRPPHSAAAPPATPQYPYQTDTMYSMPDVQDSTYFLFPGCRQCYRPY